jgi:hypothetical protein
LMPSPSGARSDCPAPLCTSAASFS